MDKETTGQLNSVEKNSEPNSLSEMYVRLNEIAATYAKSLSMDRIFGAFMRAGNEWANEPSIQNARVKAISTLPVDMTKSDLGEFLQNPYGSEKPLRQVGEALKWTAYPFYKIVKSYQDILSYKYYSKPLYVDESDIKNKDFRREHILIEKINKVLRPEIQCHKILGETLTQGKVFYHTRTKIDKSHNKVDYVFMEQLPTDWCTIIGRNNISGWTISFNLMYFLQAGTDVRQYGDLFLPYLNDFDDMFRAKGTHKKSVVYASKNGNRYALDFYPQNLKANAVGSPEVFVQNGRWFYYVTLPVEKVWTFEIDETTPNVASPLSGLFMTYAQQSDYEAAQLSLLLNPLIKIFTGEIPYFNDGTTKENAYKLSDGGRLLFQAYFDNLMAANNTSGTAFFTAPVENIKSHDFPESANANKIASSFNEYATEKSGLAAIIPMSEPKAGQASLSAKLEARYGETVYRQFERMMNAVYDSLNLHYEWEFKFFGSIYTDDETRKNANTALSNGDISAYFILAALDGESILDKIIMSKVIKENGLIDLLSPPPTSYTASKSLENSGGRPKNETITEGNEKTEDSGEENSK